MALTAALSALTLAPKLASEIAPQAEASRAPDRVFPTLERRLGDAGFLVALVEEDALFRHLVAQRGDCGLVIAKLPVQSDRDAAFAQAAQRMGGVASYYYDGAQIDGERRFVLRALYVLDRFLGPMGLAPARGARLGLIEIGDCGGFDPGLAALSATPAATTADGR